MKFRNFTKKFQFIFQNLQKLKKTRGHARFARSPLVIRLGDSRIRLGKSGYLQGGIDSIEFGVSVHRGS